MRWRDLLWFVLSWGLRRRPKDEGERLIQIASAVETDASRKREVEAMATVLGKSRDQEVFEEGQVYGLHRALERALQSRFGELAPDLIERIRAFSNRDRLLDCIAKVHQISSPEELDLTSGNGKN